MDVHDGYGQTETGALTGMPIGPPVRPGSMGTPLPGLPAVGRRGRAVRSTRPPCPPSSSTARATGLGERATAWRQDEDGYLWFEGRTDDVIISAGYRIGPFEVESALVSHPAVAEAAAVAAPDEVRGQVVRAVVVLRDGQEPGDALARELQEHVKSETAPYKYPRIVEFVDSLPKTASGKIKRAELRGVASDAWRTASRTRPPRISSSIGTTRWTGTRGARRRSGAPRAEDRPILLSIGYSACHWCHVMERESFEDEDTARLMNERFVLHQARPRGAAGHRLHLHGGLPGDDRSGRLAPQRLPHARAGAVLCGHLFPARAGLGAPSWRQVLEAVADAWADRAGEIRAGGARIAERLRGGALLQPSAEPLTEAALAEAVAGLAQAYDRVNGGFGGAPKFPPASAIELLLRRGEAEPAIQTLTGDGRRRHSRPGGRRLRALLGRRALARTPLREDALRQRAAGARVPARLAGERRPAPPRGDRDDARLDAARDAGSGGRLLLGPRRRLRGRGGPLLRLVARRAGGGARRRGGRGGRLVRRDPEGQLRGHQHPRARGGPAARARRVAAAALRGPRQARVARPRRQAADRLERPRHLGAGRGRRGARAARLPRRGPPLRGLRARRAARGGRAAAAHLEGRPRRA